MLGDLALDAVARRIEATRHLFQFLTAAARNQHEVRALAREGKRDGAAAAASR